MPDLGIATQALIRAAYGVLMTATLLQALPEARRFFLSDEFSLVDASVAPLLWRLPTYGVELNGSGALPIRKYMDGIFARRSFRESLTEVEMEMRQ